MVLYDLLLSFIIIITVIITIIKLNSSQLYKNCLYKIILILVNP